MKALIIIDVQNFYFVGDSSLEGNLDAVQNTAAVLDHFRKNGLPVIYVQHVLDVSHLPKEQHSIIDIHERIRPMDGEVVVQKHTPGSFNKTQLKAELDALGVTELVICGMMSHMCVDTTTREAFDLGYAVTVIHDACATRALEFNGITVPAQYVHATSMAALAYGFAKLMSTQEYIGNSVG